MTLTAPANKDTVYRLVKLFLRNGKVALIDDEDFEKVSATGWYANQLGNGWYVVATDRSRKLLHREIMNAPDGIQVHHVNGDGLDNRKQNLMLATPQENRRGFQQKAARAKSQFRGVSPRRSGKPWVAHIKVNGQSRHLGVFEAEDAAARAYDLAAITEFGKFAHLNFPTES